MELRTEEDCKRLLKIIQDEYSRISISLQQVMEDEVYPRLIDLESVIPPDIEILLSEIDSVKSEVV